MGNEFNAADDEIMNSGALDWDSSIEKDDSFELLPEGEYSFTVEAMERGRFPGSSKMSACPMANLTIQVTNTETGMKGKIFDTLYLHSKAEWRLSQFFVSIGQKKKGEPLNPNWGQVAGSSGKLELSVNEYKKDGESRKNNRVSRYLPKEQKSFVPGQF